MSEISTRYCDTRPSLDVAEARAKELEAEVEALRTELAEQKALLADQEERNKQMYLKMYSKGQEAARIEQADQVILIPPREISIFPYVHRPNLVYHLISGCRAGAEKP